MRGGGAGGRRPRASSGCAPQACGRRGRARSAGAVCVPNSAQAPRQAGAISAQIGTSRAGGRRRRRRPDFRISKMYVVRLGLLAPSSCQKLPKACRSRADPPTAAGQCRVSRGGPAAGGSAARSAEAAAVEGGREPPYVADPACSSAARAFLGAHRIPRTGALATAAAPGRVKRAPKGPQLRVIATSRRRGPGFARRPAGRPRRGILPRVGRFRPST